MIKRVIVQNFMAHKSTTLDLAEGVTIITGPNNTGKSALVEAIRSVVQNPPQSRHAVRHGEKSSIVRLELDSGEVIEWERNDKAAIYRIFKSCDDEQEDSEPETYAKFGRTPPDDVKELLRLDAVQTESGDVDIHIGNQRYPIFLLDQAGSQAASFFAASTEAEYLLRMQQVLKSKTDWNRSRRKELSKECRELEEELKRYILLDAVGALLTNAEETYERFMELKRALPGLDHFIAQLSEILYRLGKAHERSLAIEPLTPPPLLNETGILDDLIGSFDGSILSCALLQTHQDLFTGLREVPVIAEVNFLAEIVSSMAETSGILSTAAGKAETLGNIQGPPELRAVRDLGFLLQDMEEIDSGHFIAAGKLEVLAGLPDLPVPMNTVDFESILVSLDRMNQLYGQRLSAAGALARLEHSPPLQELRDLDELVKMTDNAVGRLRGASSMLAALRLVETPPCPWDLERLKELISSLNELDSRKTRCGYLSRVASEIQSPPVLRSSDALKEMIDHLTNLQISASSIKAGREILDCITPVPKLSPVEELSIMLTNIADLHEKISEVDRTHQEHLLAISIKRQQIELVIAETGTCPFCGHILDLEHFLEGAHA